MIPEQQNRNDAHADREPLDQWNCPKCYQTISSRRTPVYNANNCSCAEAASFSTGKDLLPETAVFQTANPIQQQLQSYASSDVSVTCPEGPEHTIPDHDVNNFIQLGPDRGLGEEQHRRSAYFHSEMPWQMRQWFVEQTDQPDFFARSAAPLTTGLKRCLPQTLHILSQQLKTQRTSHSSRRSGSENLGDSILGLEDVEIIGIGGWDHGELGEYPLYLSGMTGTSSG